MFTKQFWVSTAKQVVGVMAATAAGLLPAATALNEVDWKVYAISVGLAGAAVLLKALAASAVGNSDTPNFDKKSLGEY